MPNRDNEVARPPMRDYTSRGFEHIVDMFQGGLDDWYTHLLARQEEFGRGITDRQKELVALRVGHEYADMVSEELPRLAAHNLARRAIEEHRSLEIAGVEKGSPFSREYLKFAGNVEYLSDYIAWLDKLAVSGLSTVIERPLVAIDEDGEITERTFREHVKGLAFELGGCFELGDLSHQHGVEEIKAELVSALVLAGFEYKHPEQTDRFSISALPKSSDDMKPKDNRHRILAVATIDSPIADGYRNGDGAIHVAQRSEKLIVYPNLPPNVASAVSRFVPRLPPKEEMQDLKEDDWRALREGSDETARVLGRYASLAVDSPAVVPISTVLYARSVHPRD